MRYISVLLFLVFCSHVKAASNITVYTPSLPKVIDPYESNDVFSALLNTQIHSPLFILNSVGVPEPKLVESFSFDRTKKELQIEVKDIFFEDGTKLTSKHVISSIKEILDLKAFGYSRLSCIEGYKKGTLSGLRSVSIKSVRIKSKCSVKKLLNILSDYRLVISKRGEKGRLGLGAYKVSSVSRNKVVLASRVSGPYFEKIEFVQKNTLKSAISHSVRNNHQSIFVKYPSQEVESSDKSSLKVVPAFASKNYLFALNTRSLTPGEIAVASAEVGWYDIIDKCFKGAKRTSNFLPKGHLGYRGSLRTKGVEFKPKNTKKFSLSIGIAKGVGSESCVRDSLSNNSPEIISVKPTVVETSELFDRFLSGKIDAIFLYMETEPYLDMLQFYVPKRGFTLGPEKGWNKISSLFEIYTTSENKEEKDKLAAQIQSLILSKRTVIPLFEERDRILFSKSITGLDPGALSISYFRFEDLKGPE